MLQVQGRTRNLKKHDHLPERHEAKIGCIVSIVPGGKPAGK